MSELVKRASGAMKLGKARPLWYDTVKALYPPISFAAPLRADGKKEPMRKPPKIVFPEDALRRRIYNRFKCELNQSTTLDERMPRSTIER